MQKTEGGIVTSYSYDARNRLVEVTKPTGTLRYGYDTDGIRTSKTEGGVTTSYVVDHNRQYAQVLAELEDGVLSKTYTYGDDLVSQQAVGGSDSFYLYDGLGTTRGLTDGSGVLSDQYFYEAFGELLASTGSTVNSYLFTGEQFDADLEQYYLRARYYDPSVGRFTQMDTWQGRLQEPVTLHKYLYANGDPARFVDPSGRVGIAKATVALGVASTLANIGISTATIGLISAGAASDPNGPGSGLLPDGVMVSLRAGAAGRGISGSGGGDLVYDFRSGELWSFGALEGSVDPISMFKKTPILGVSATAGPIWNMDSPQQFSGSGLNFSATWPLKAAHLLTHSSIFRKGPMWGFLTQTRKLSKNNKGWSMQFGFAGTNKSSPAFIKIGPRQSMFSTDIFGLSYGSKTGQGPNQSQVASEIKSILKAGRTKNADVYATIVNRLENLNISR